MRSTPMMLCIFFSFIVSLSNYSSAALVVRDLDGNASTFEALYDDVLNITWLADANLAASNTFGVSLDGFSPGRMGWTTANTYISAMNTATYLGQNTWRLASFDGGNELLHMYSNNLGGTSGAVSGALDPNSYLPLISNLQDDRYWYAEELIAGVTARIFLFEQGYSASANLGNTFYVWAVVDGDVGAAVVPVPAAIWLFGSALAGLIGIRIKRR